MLLASLVTVGPLIPRLIARDQVIEPMFAVMLQRDDVEVGGNAGILSIGGLPRGVNPDNLKWAPVRLYTEEQGGIRSPLDAPNEVRIIATEER